MGVKVFRQQLHDAAIRFATLRDLDSALTLDEVAEQYGVAKRRARVRREKWRERQEEKERQSAPVGDGIKVCRVEGCRLPPEYRPVILFPAEDEGEDPIRAETALLDVCEAHARSLGPDAYTENEAVWRAISKVWTDNGLPAPDPEAATVEYVQIPDSERAR